MNRYEIPCGFFDYEIVLLFLFLYNRVKETKEALEILDRYDQLMEKINAFKKKLFDDWTVNVPKTVEEKTNYPILSRNGVDLILNFSPDVSVFILDVDYFQYANNIN